MSRSSDSCSHGLKEKAPADGSQSGLQENRVRRSAGGLPAGGTHFGIPETQDRRRSAVGALAMITLDNPMVAATGHRICNDCMKSCIYQKQEPVNIPQAETRTLKDVLELPWGFEIYSLLTRWNPLDLRAADSRARRSGRRVLIAGMGPAGFTVAHHLMNDGHTVVGVDGLKIEPLPAAVCRSRCRWYARWPSSRSMTSNRCTKPLDDRVMAGFGGVAEYGITVRWDKNFLKLIRLLLQRRAGVRLVRRRAFRRHAGRSTTLLHWASIMSLLAAGAGRPTVLDIPNGLAPGVRTASDFLMALQLTGAAKNDSIANMQLRLPVVVIGGGLTAIDTATESLAYYPLQVEKFLRRFEALCAERGEDEVRGKWSRAEQTIAEEFLAHARAIRGGARAGRSRRPRRRESSNCCNPGAASPGLSQAPDRQSLVHAEPRGNRKSAGGRHPLRRKPDTRRGGRSTSSAMPAD